MNSAEIQTETLAIEKLVDEGKLFEAIAKLRSQPNWLSCGLDNKLLGIEFAYNSMLDFYKSERQDPQRDSIYSHVIADLYSVIYQWADTEAIKAESSYIRYRNINNLNIAEASSYVELYHNSKKKYDLMPQPSVVLPEMESAVRNLFNIIWSFNPSSELCEVTSSFINDNNNRIEDRELIVGALVLAVSQRFIPSYISILFTLCHATENTIRSKSISGVMLCVIRHSDRILTDQHLYAQWEALITNIADKRALAIATMAILKTVQTNDITEKMRNDVAPTILSMKENSEQLGLSSLYDIDWDDVIGDKKHIKKSINKLMKWQMEGADIFLSTFSHLKDYPFFREISNWLMPFDLNNSYLAKALEDVPQTFRQSFLKGIQTATVICESDKYSVLMSFAYIPQGTRENICEMYTRELEAITEINNGEMTYGTHNCIADQYIRDLYRLFYVHPRRKEFINPFEKLATFLSSSQLFKKTFFDDEREAMADYIGHQSQYSMAKRIYLGIKNNTSKSFIKKLIFCHMADNECQEALLLLDKLDSMGGDNIWILKMRIRCYHFMHITNYEIDNLNTLITLQPNDIQLKQQLANCYISSKQYGNALQLMYEVDYLSPTTESAMQVAHCMLYTGKGADAIRYTTRDENIKNNNLVIAAFVSLCSHNTSKAIEQLSKYNNINNIDTLAEYEKYQLSFEANNISIHDLKFVIDIATQQAQKGEK